MYLLFNEIISSPEICSIEQHFLLYSCVHGGVFFIFLCCLDVDTYYQISLEDTMNVM